MEPTLRWIEKAQERHKEVKGSYTEDMSSLIKEGFDIEDKSIAEDLAEQVKKYKRYPGMSYDKTHSGPTFYYEIRPPMVIIIWSKRLGWDSPITVEPSGKLIKLENSSTRLNRN